MHTFGFDLGIGGIPWWGQLPANLILYFLERKQREEILRYSEEKRLLEEKWKLFTLKSTPRFGFLGAVVDRTMAILFKKQKEKLNFLSCKTVNVSKEKWLNIRSIGGNQVGYIWVG